jgi:hypothetical protein
MKLEPAQCKNRNLAALRNPPHGKTVVSEAEKYSAGRLAPHSGRENVRVVRKQPGTGAAGRASGRTMKHVYVPVPTK